MNRIYLIGYMGSGKSTVAKALAVSKGFSFLDLDELICERSGYSIEQLFSFYGEARFRELESSALRSTFAKENIVVATGGGAPCFFDNIESMKSKGRVFYLSLDANVLAERLKLDEENIRPLIHSKSDEELIEFITIHLEQRLPFYSQAHHTLDGSQSEQQVVREISRIMSEN